MDTKCFINHLPTVADRTTWRVFEIIIAYNFIIFVDVWCLPEEMLVSEYSLELHYEVNELCPKYTQTRLLRVSIFLSVDDTSNCPAQFLGPIFYTLGLSFGSLMIRSA